MTMGDGMKSLVKIAFMVVIAAAFSWGAAWTGTKTQPETTTVDEKHSTKSNAYACYNSAIEGEYVTTFRLDNL